MIEVILESAKLTSNPIKKFPHLNMLLNNS